MFMILCRPTVEVGWCSSLGVNSCTVTARACKCKVCDACQVGQSLGEVSQIGPCFHRLEDFSWSDEIPRVTAGLSEVGQKCHLMSPVNWCISLTRCDTNVSSFLLLCSQYSTIWLSVHKLSVRCIGLSASLMKLLILSAMSAPINSSLGRDSCLNGATLHFAITKDTWLFVLMKATAP